MKQTKEEIQQLRDLPYHEYLQTDHWKQLSRTVKIRDEFRCSCGNKNDLNVHHTSYENKGNFELELGDCVTCCNSCHKVEHNLYDTKLTSISEIANKLFHNIST